MEPQPSTPQDSQGPASTSYTVSLTARACLQALELAAWIEAMVLAHRAAQPQGASAWCWFLVRCVLFSFGAYVVIGVMAEIAKRRSMRGSVAVKPDRQDRPETPSPVVPLLFDEPAYEALAGALLFHFGPPIWMRIFA